MVRVCDDLLQAFSSGSLHSDLCYPYRNKKFVVSHVRIEDKLMDIHILPHGKKINNRWTGAFVVDKFLTAARKAKYLTPDDQLDDAASSKEV